MTDLYVYMGKGGMIEGGVGGCVGVGGGGAR